MIKWFQKLKPVEQVIAAAIILVILIWLWKLIRAYVKNIVSGAETIGEVAALQSAGMKKTYTDSQYNSFADQLYFAMKGAGTDEDSVFSVMGKMKNDLDVIELERKYGLRPDMWGNQYNLQQWLRGDLGSSDIQRLNSLLSSKGITKSY